MLIGVFDASIQNHQGTKSASYQGMFFFKACYRAAELLALFCHFRTAMLQTSCDRSDILQAATEL
jgi:hypothetical protein